MYSVSGLRLRCDILDRVSSVLLRVYSGSEILALIVDGTYFPFCYFYAMLYFEDVVYKAKSHFYVNSVHCVFSEP